MMCPVHLCPDFLFPRQHSREWGQAVWLSTTNDRRDKVKGIIAVLFALLIAQVAHAGQLLPGGVQLLCHRTANEDVPENTLESLDQAALLGCNVVEIDLRRTADGRIVLNHDGILERLSDGVGEVDQTYYSDLELRDFGSWMGEPFTGMRITLFEDALRLARERDIRLALDIKEKGIDAQVLEIVEREGMLRRVQFGSETAEVKKLDPAATGADDGTVGVQPGVTAEQVKQYHGKGKAVVVNFSANGHEMDLAGMKAAVAAGADGINVDYPRLGADAVGRPVERRLHELILQADSGQSGSRTAAILELSRYRGFPLQADFARWMLDADDSVSRAAALALVTARPQTPPQVFAHALRSEHADARKNAAWALGMLHSPASFLLPLLKDKDPQVLQSSLLALGRAPGDVSADALLPLLSNADPRVRGAAAIALARHQPELAVSVVPAQLRKEVAAEKVLYEHHVTSEAPETFTQPEIDAVMTSFKCQMEMVRAISMLKSNQATSELESIAFQPDKSFSQYDGIVAGFQLWDRIGADATPAMQALESSDQQVADRAEWMLVKAGPAVLPDVRKDLQSTNQEVRQRAIQIVAWQGDKESVGSLQAIRDLKGPDAALAAWAIVKIESLHSEQ
jgi:glycerophosphoryl diester phosphodiesterase/HEAT repeat protein